MKKQQHKKTLIVSAGIIAALVLIFLLLLCGRPFIGSSAPEVILVTRLNYGEDAASHAAGDYRLLPGDAGYQEMAEVLSSARWRYDLDFAQSTVLGTPCQSCLIMLNGTSFQLTDTGLMWRNGKQVHIGLHSRANIQKLYQEMDAAIHSAIPEDRS